MTKKNHVQLDVRGLLKGKPAAWIVSTTDKQDTLYDLVEMTDEQAKAMAHELEAARQSKRIADYNVWLVIDGLRKHVEYAPILSDWLKARVPGEVRVTKG